MHKRGRNVGGLLRYLFGPGKREEHHNPHLVAVWSGPDQLAALQPATTGGRHHLATLTRALEQPVRAGKNPPPRPVWHVSVRNHPTDRILTDAQWAHIAGEIVAATGVAPHGDLDACRWVAVRHADDHIHIVATLVRQDGDTEWAWNDGMKAQAAARDLEHRYNLHRVGPVDRTSHRRPKPAEQNKTRRQHRPEIPRDQLRREVRAAAAGAVDEAEFFRRLAANGVLVRLRHSTTNPGQVTGYAVGLPQHHTADGQTVWYGGGRLAPDLTLPRLRHRWNNTDRSGVAAASTGDRQRHRARTFRRASTVAGQAANRIARHTRTVADIGPLAQAAADVLASAARAMDGRKRGDLAEVVDIFDRAVRDARPHRINRASIGGELRSMSRLIAVMGRLTDDEDTAAAFHLLQTMAMFADNLAAVREAQQRQHQATAARNAAERLRALVAQHQGSVPPSQTTTVSATAHVERRSTTRRSRST